MAGMNNAVQILSGLVLLQSEAVFANVKPDIINGTRRERVESAETVGDARGKLHVIWRRRDNFGLCRTPCKVLHLGP